jgi:hypothetical protein
MGIFPLLQYKQDPAAVQLEMLRYVLMDFLLQSECTQTERESFDQIAAAALT